ncbi:MAG: hypothetical protein JJU27_13410, partial [Gammaproteobacteria bacterium]|nr:hypothetical protein [Gammaproteobacteria bacterium]
MAVAMLSPSSGAGVLRMIDVAAAPVARILERYATRRVDVPAGEPIPGSYWGDCEAGLITDALYLRADTPLHSMLHELAHRVCMDPARRARRADALAAALGPEVATAGDLSSAYTAAEAGCPPVVLVASELTHPAEFLMVRTLIERLGLELVVLGPAPPGPQALGLTLLAEIGPAMHDILGHQVAGHRPGAPRP